MSEASEQASDPRIGTVIGERYHLTGLLGEGGMGAVFRAEHVLMKKTVALKLLHPELGRIEEIALRFEREAQSVSRLSHPGIIQVSDFGRTTDGVLFLVMEFLPGESLATVLAREGRLSPERAVGIMQQVLAALDHAHSLGVVHRDLKPDNIMLTRREDKSVRDNVKLLDFGIAKMSGESPAAGQPLTQAGVVFGTPWYMSPEQALGEHTDGRSDLYSCGVILHELITGKRPFEAAELVQIISMHLTVAPTPLRQAAPDVGVPTAVEAAVLRAMSKTRDERFATAVDFLAALTGHAHSPAAVLPRPSSIFAVAADPSGGRRFTLTLDIDRLRADARAFWQGLSSRGRRVLFGATAALLLLSLVLVIRSVARPSQPRPIAANIALALKPAEDAIARGDLSAARALLMHLLSEHPDAARVHYAVGTLDFVERRPETALGAYRQAIRLDPGYKGDAAILRNVQALVDDKKLGAVALTFLVQDVGKSAGPVLAQIASSDKRSELRRTASVACEQLGCAKQIDRLQSYVLDLGQGKRCEDRRDAVVKLQALGDPRALDALKKLKRRGGGFLGMFNNGNDCMKKELDVAIQSLESK